MTIDSMISRPSTAAHGAARDRRNLPSGEIEKLLRSAADRQNPRRSEQLEQAIILSVPMARTLAARYQRRGVDTDDLAQVAYVGLVKAAHGYRPGPETDFRSYAIPTIRGEIRRHFRDRAWMVRPPRRIQDLQTAINAAEGELPAILHRWPTEEDLAEAIGVPVEQIIDAQRAQGCFHPVSLDARLTATSSLSLANIVADENDTYRLVDNLEALRPAVADLPPRDRLILRRRFVDHRTQAEIGDEIGVSQMQVSRLLHQILVVLRSALSA
ncbi:MAG TPA: sigma-70 family RNA polymerase sigma factor [Kribbella sp.]